MPRDNIKNRLINSLTLKILSKKPEYGSAILQQIHQITLGYLSLDITNYYRKLQELEKKGYIQAQKKAGRIKLYKLTAAGEEKLPIIQRDYMRMIDSFSDVFNVKLDE